MAIAKKAAKKTTKKATKKPVAKKTVKKEKETASLKITCTNNKVDVEIAGSKVKLLAAFCSLLTDDSKDNIFRVLVNEAVMMIVSGVLEEEKAKKK